MDNLNTQKGKKAKKRLNVEIARNYDIFDKYQEVFWDENSICVKNKYNVKIKIIINDDYPFKIPYISVNNYKYGDLLENRLFSTKLTNDYFKYKLKPNHSFCCIQCNTIIRKHIWAPNYGIKEIFDEINEIFEVKQKIIEIICVSVISRKYFPSFINKIIISYILDFCIVLT